MATFNKQPNGKVRAAVFASGRRYTKVLDTATLAKKWAATIEAQSHAPVGSNLLLSDVLRRYRDEVSSRKKTAIYEERRINAISSGFLGQMRIANITSPTYCKMAGYGA